MSEEEDHPSRLPTEFRNDEAKRVMMMIIIITTIVIAEASHRDRTGDTRRKAGDRKSVRAISSERLVATCRVRALTASPSKPIVCALG